MIKLNDTQREIYELEQYCGSGATFLAAEIFLQGTANKVYMQECMEEILKKNDVFHMHIIKNLEDVVWEVEENVQYTEKYHIWTFDSRDVYDSWVQKELQKQNLSVADLYAFHLIVLPEQFGLYFQLSHIISDAWTLSKLGEQFSSLYESKLKQNPFQLEKRSYIDFIKKENEYTLSEKCKKAQNYWKNQIDTFHDFVGLTNQSITSLQTKRFDKVVCQELSERIRDFCIKYSISEYTLYLSSFGALFHEMSHAKQFYIGSTVLNRTGINQKNTLGLFANTIPFYFEFLDQKLSVRDYISVVQRSIFTGFRYQKYTYNKILKHNNIGRVFDVSLNFQSASMLDFHKYDIALYPTRIQAESLIVHVLQTIEGQYQLLFDYQADAFEEWEINALQNHLLNFM